jgi:DNA-binding PadR family transcriptional regulator
MFRNTLSLSSFHNRLDAIGARDGGPRGRSWYGGFGHPGGFRGGGDFPGARKLSAAELQLVLLALLAEQPAHGYELIRTLEERSGGFYAPSPGMIYPALTYLEEIGHAAVSPDGNRKLYTLTESGRAELAAHKDQADAILAALNRIGARMDQVREAFSGLDDPDPQAAEDLHRARHELKHALMRKRGCTPAEARRVAEILKRATADILKDGQQ